jgi:hypothetical protein
MAAHVDVHAGAYAAAIEQRAAPAGACGAHPLSLRSSLSMEYGGGNRAVLAGLS